MPPEHPAPSPFRPPCDLGPHRRAPARPGDGETQMNIKTGILAAAAALALTLPAAAFAQPYYGHGDDRGRYDSYGRDHDDWRRVEREREIRREAWRRLQWEREHGRYGYSPY